MNLKKAVIGLVTFLFISCENSNNNPLVGTWELESASWNGENMEIREPRMVKVFTEKYVIFNYYESNLVENETLLAAAFGEYTFMNGTLKEIIKNHTRADNIGNEYDIDVKMDSDRNAYTQTLKFNDEVTLIETWKRIE
tara:strand:+ start:899 stop:1315 length:417 start_codon:yes stop_codon:yes gene_type:complete